MAIHPWYACLYSINVDGQFTLFLSLTKSFRIEGFSFCERVNVYGYVCMFVRMLACMFVYVCVCACACLRVYVSLYACYKQMCVYEWLFTWCVCVCVCVCVFVSAWEASIVFLCESKHACSYLYLVLGKEFIVIIGRWSLQLVTNTFLSSLSLSRKLCTNLLMWFVSSKTFFRTVTINIHHLNTSLVWKLYYRSHVTD